MIAAGETEHDWLRSVRQARGDLIAAPAMPVTAFTLPDDDDVTRLCAGCDMVPGELAVFLDRHGWIWCQRCAGSDVIGAAFTAAELAELMRAVGSGIRKLAGALAATGESGAYRVAEADVDRHCLADGDLNALRGQLAAMPQAGLVANPFGLAY